MMPQILFLFCFFNTFILLLTTRVHNNIKPEDLSVNLVTYLLVRICYLRICTYELILDQNMIHKAWTQFPILVSVVGGCHSAMKFNFPTPMNGASISIIIFYWNTHFPFSFFSPTYLYQTGNFLFKKKKFYLVL
jgi:hypothetical protein